MSHLTTVKTVIKNLDALKEASKTAELVFTEHQVPTQCTYYMSKSEDKFNYIISKQGQRWDMGVKENKDGSFQLIGDEMLFNKHGVGATLLKEYHLEVLKRQARAKGANLNVVRHQNGKITARIEVR